MTSREIQKRADQLSRAIPPTMSKASPVEQFLWGISVMVTSLDFVELESFFLTEMARMDKRRFSKARYKPYKKL